MGAWGAGIWDNDSSCDLKDTFDMLIINGNTERQAFDIIKNDDSLWGDSWAVLGLAELQLNVMGKIDPDLNEKVKNALERELDTIEDWKEDVRGERKKVVQELQSRILTSVKSFTGKKDKHQPKVQHKSIINYLLSNLKDGSQCSFSFSELKKEIDFNDIESLKHTLFPLMSDTVKIETENGFAETPICSDILIEEEKENVQFTFSNFFLKAKKIL